MEIDLLKEFNLFPIFYIEFDCIKMDICMMRNSTKYTRFQCNHVIIMLCDSLPKMKLKIFDKYLSYFLFRSFLISRIYLSFPFYTER